MKSVKVYWNGKPLRKIYPYATKWQMFKYRLRKFFRKVLIALGLSLAMALIFQLGGMLNPALQYHTVEAIKEVETPSPVLERIAKCESGILIGIKMAKC